MKQETLLEVVHDNPESTILIRKFGTKEVVRIDVDKYSNFDVQKGEGLSGVGIGEREKERRKSRKDLKMKLSNGGFDKVKSVHAISRINEDEKEDDGRNVQI